MQLTQQHWMLRWKLLWMTFWLMTWISWVKMSWQLAGPYQLMPRLPPQLSKHKKQRLQQLRYFSLQLGLLRLHANFSAHHQSCQWQFTEMANVTGTTICPVTLHVANVCHVPGAFQSEAAFRCFSASVVFEYRLNKSHHKCCMGVAGCWLSGFCMGVVALLGELEK